MDINALVIVCMFSHSTEVFSYKQDAASSVAKVLLGEVIPTWGIPLKLHNNQGTHFTGQEFVLYGFPKISVPGLLEICFQTFNDDITLQMNFSVYDIEHKQTSDKNAWEIFLLPFLFTQMWPQ